MGDLPPGARTPGPPLLAIEALEVRFDGAMALDGASLRIAAGELVCVVGANGAGKTTLIRAIAGMVTAKRGRVVWKGRDITGLPPWEVCELGIAQVAEGRQIFPTMTIAENLALGGALRRARKNRRRNLERVHALFPRLLERRGQAAGTLSGGEQQMLAIARGMMADPDLIMLDEPSIGLSPAMTRTMFDTIRGLHADGVTILLVEQNVAESLQLCDRGYVLENGGMSLEGSGPALLADDAVRRAYLGL